MTIDSNKFIGKNKFVAISYKLYVFDEEDPSKRELWEEAPEDAPFKFTCGLGMVIDNLERSLVGLYEGDLFSIPLLKEDAYGDYEDGRVVELEKKIFCVDGNFDDEYIKEGNIVPMMDADGNRMYGIVLEVGKDKVKMDFNHPLAGENLLFVGKVVEVRDATPEEIAVATKPHKCGSCSGSCGDCEGGCGGGNEGCNGGCGNCGN